MVLKLVNVFFKQNFLSVSHYSPENYDGVEYTVKPNDTLYSILNFLGKENGISQKVVSTTLDFLKNKNIVIHPGNKISLELPDNHTVELSINDKVFTIDLNMQESVKETKDGLSSIQKEICDNLGDSEKCVKQLLAYLQGRSSLAALEESKNLYNSEDPLKQDMALILEVLSLEYNDSEELQKSISQVLDSKVLPRGVKLAFLKKLKENNFNLPSELDSTELANKIIKKYPTYAGLFDDFKQIIDPNDGKTAYSNLVA